MSFSIEDLNAIEKQLEKTPFLNGMTYGVSDNEFISLFKRNSTLFHSSQINASYFSSIQTERY